MGRAAKSDSDLTKEDFINDMVLKAVNPHPQYGYAHGKFTNHTFKSYNNHMKVLSLITTRTGYPRIFASPGKAVFAKYMNQSSGDLALRTQWSVYAG
jgi:hypothetical protein